jgi:hypothetical protein
MNIKAQASHLVIKNGINKALLISSGQACAMNSGQSFRNKWYAIYKEVELIAAKNSHQVITKHESKL